MFVAKHKNSVKLEIAISASMRVGDVALMFVLIMLFIDSFNVMYYCDNLAV